MTEHFSSDDITAWEDTVQGNADAVDASPSETTPEGVPEDLAAKAAEWAGTQQGNESGADDAEAAEDPGD